MPPYNIRGEIMIEHLNKYNKGMKDIELLALRCKHDLVYEILVNIQKTKGWQDDPELEHFNTEMNDTLLLIEKEMDKLR